MCVKSMGVLPKRDGSVITMSLWLRMHSDYHINEHISKSAGE